ncbi:GNAT family N-acetyltransferase [Hugenholtzia roseola]|uniref:GNAT family N-acetyltransferase n=1 Tax=Hugenholtzia roseola TaxID=1002 RepID=UPI0003F773A6|nr:GNAT family N-acetyltransferase [Hugenholtzia roseola]
MKILTFHAQKEMEQYFSFSEIVDFLYKNLDQYGDKKEDIAKCLRYAFAPERGGAVHVGFSESDTERQVVLGVVVTNQTGMQGYIPENILVYIAINQQFRGKGFGKKMMLHALAHTEGDIALHVEKNNPARFLYEKLGFETPYLEMRLKR